MRTPGEKPAISDTARARIQMFHEQLQKLENLWGVRLEFNGSADALVYVDEQREDDFDGLADYDAFRTEDGKLEFEAFDWWGK